MEDKTADVFDKLFKDVARVLGGPNTVYLYKLIAREWCDIRRPIGRPLKDPPKVPLTSEI